MNDVARALDGNPVFVGAFRHHSIFNVIVGVDAYGQVWHRHPFAADPWKPWAEGLGDTCGAESCLAEGRTR